MSDKNCNSCAKQNVCPKARNIENYYIDSCAQYISDYIPSETLLCSECGGSMEFIHEYHYNTLRGRMVNGEVYHCDQCGNDDVIEKTWECINTERRHYFHG